MSLLVSQLNWNEYKLLDSYKAPSLAKMLVLEYFPVPSTRSRYRLVPILARLMAVLLRMLLYWVNGKLL
jgi:hypothetical protein